MPIQTTQQIANSLNPTPINLATPSDGQIYRDSQSNGLYAMSGSTLYGVGTGNAQQYLTQFGIDINSIPTISDTQLADMNRARPGFNYVSLNNNSGGITDPNLFKSLFSKPSAATTSTQTVNTTPNQLGDIAGATAAQTQQLAGDQGQNVTQTTTPEGVSAVQKTPLGTPAAQTTGQQAGSSQSPSSTAGAAAGAPINYNKLPTETIDQYNARIAASGGPVAPTGTTTGAAGNIDTNYQIQPGESIPAYNARIASYNASKPTTTVSGQVGSSGTMGQSNGAGNDPYAGLDPIQKQVKMYTDAYKALGLDTIKQQFDDYTKQQKDLTDEMNKKIADTQNNPWLSQGVADRTVNRIKDSYATKLDTLTHLLSLTDSLYKQGQAQVDHMVSEANADIKATNDLAQKQIDAANALAKDNVVESIGGRELLINKDTGKTIADLGATTPSSSSGFNLSPGQTHFDANGNPIASVAPKPTSSTSTTTAKGTQTSQAFVENTLSTQGLNYDTVISSIPTGRMGVIDNKTGTVGSILPSEFSAAKYTQL